MSRLFTITGTFRQVCECFDIIADFLFRINSQSAVVSGQSFHVLIEHSKAGKLIGTNGTTLQSIKKHSHCSQIRICKEQNRVHGVNLRVMIFEGPIVSVKHAHRICQSILAEPAPLGVVPATAEKPSLSIGKHHDESKDGQGLALPALVSLGVSLDAIQRVKDLQEYLVSRQNSFNLSQCSSQPMHPFTDFFRTCFEHYSY